MYRRIKAIKGTLSLYNISFALCHVKDGDGGEGALFPGWGRSTNIARLPNGLGWTLASFPGLLHLQSTTVGFPEKEVPELR